jgi:hypothetical protein
MARMIEDNARSLAGCDMACAGLWGDLDCVARTASGVRKSIA